MSLPPFNPDAKCPKCANPVITTRWKVASDIEGIRREWLSRRCSRCDYIWDEAVIEEQPNG